MGINGFVWKTKSSIFLCQLLLYPLYLLHSYYTNYNLKFCDLANWPFCFSSFLLDFYFSKTYQLRWKSLKFVFEVSFVFLDFLHYKKPCRNPSTITDKQQSTLILPFTTMLKKQINSYLTIKMFNSLRNDYFSSWMEILYQNGASDIRVWRLDNTVHGTCVTKRWPCEPLKGYVITMMSSKDASRNRFWKIWELWLWEVEKFRKTLKRVIVEETPIWIEGMFDLDQGKRPR